MVSDMKSSWRHVARGMSQFLIPGPILLNVFVNETDDRIVCTLSKWVSDAKLEELLIHEIAVLLYDGWRSGLTGLSRTLTKGNAKFCMWGLIPCTSVCHRLIRGEKRTNLTEPRNVPSWQRKSTSSWAALGRSLSAGRGMWSFPST